MNEDILIYDIETKVFGKPDSSKDRLKIFGCFSYKTGKYYLLEKKEDVQKIIKAHRFLVGFNNKEYDDPILKREGIKLDYKTIIDLRELITRRAPMIKIDKGILNDLLMRTSLDFITRLLGLVTDDSAKGDIDYKVFMKDVWTADEKKTICEYAKRDIEVTKKLYEWAETYFAPFKDFISKEDVKKKLYLTATIAKFAYKAICKAMGWNEQYGEVTEGRKTISGGYVGYPAGERFGGNIFCLDYNSLYPHIMMQANLYGRKKEGALDDRAVWFGDNKWKVKGTYYGDRINDVGLLLKKWYADRVKYKKVNDRREYTIKIIINTIYGILDNPYYSLVYDQVAASDCTRLGRQWCKYARKKFRDAGYKVIYTDTDSVYIIDHLNDKEKMLRVKDEIIFDIKDTVPFPQDTFDMGIDDEIKFMYFFKGKGIEDKDSDKHMDSDDFIYKPLNFMKKNYIYVTTENKVKVKNLGIKKKSNSPLSRKIFWDYLVPEIKKGKCKFSKAYIKGIMDKLLEENIELAALRKSVGTIAQYSKKSPNSLPAQIARKYGNGIYFLIPNTAGVGVGKGKNYCTIEEFKARQLKIKHIDLSNVWRELNYFIRPVVIKNIFDFEEK